MTTVTRLRDSTQIVVPDSVSPAHLRAIDQRYTVSIRHEGDRIRIIGSPVEIKAVERLLTQRGISLA